MPCPKTYQYKSFYVPHIPDEGENIKIDVGSDECAEEILEHTTKDRHWYLEVNGTNTACMNMDELKLFLMLLE